MVPADGESFGLIGNSQFVDLATGREVNSSWIIRDAAGELVVQVGESGAARDGESLATRNRHTRWYFAQLRLRILATRRRESAPRPVPKQKRQRRQRQTTSRVCPECNGTRETYIKDRLVSCPACTGPRQD